MDDFKKQLLALLEEAKASLEAIKQSVKNIEAALASTDNEGVATASEEGDPKPQKPGKPLPGQGNNGGINP